MPIVPGHFMLTYGTGRVLLVGRVSIIKIAYRFSFYEQSFIFPFLEREREREGKGGGVLNLS